MTDRELKPQIERALDFEPSLDTSDIGVSVDEGVVTLRGTVGSYVEKIIAERVALKVYGVKAVANDLAVHLVDGFERTDTDIAQAAVSALRWNAMVPADRITVTVSNGWVALAGTVEWQFQKAAAARAVRDLTGVKGVSNDILVLPRVRATDVRHEIESAFARNAVLDPRRVDVAAHNGTVVLSGTVHSWAEREEAERAAWAAPGVMQVEDRIAVVP